MKTEYTYIVFRQLPFRGKTLKWSCYNKGSGVLLGQVSWYPSWRQYCFFPTPGMQGTVFSSGCLHDVQDFIVQCEEARKTQQSIQDAEDEADKLAKKVQESLRRAGLTFRPRRG
jgi:hypothetical protein